MEFFTYLCTINLKQNNMESKLVGKVWSVKLGKTYHFIFPDNEKHRGGLQSSDVIIILDVMGNMIDPEKYDDLCEEFDKYYYIDQKTGDIFPRE